MFICLKCNKQFKYESKLNEHKNRKTKCKPDNIDYPCSLCDVKFKYKSEFERHEKSNKHIKNINIHNSVINNHIGDNITNNFNNIVNLTLNTNTFSDTNISYVSNLCIDVAYTAFTNIKDNKYLSDYNKTLTLFNDVVIYILDKLHFNISNSENHNLKILLMFPKIDKDIYEYLILEINKETNALVWNSISYEQLLHEIINLLNNINTYNIQRYNNYEREENLIFQQFIDYLTINLFNHEFANELKKQINKSLGLLYLQINKQQKKPDRDVKQDLLQKINEYKNYRSDECRLSNGFTPEIINSEI